MAPGGVSMNKRSKATKVAVKARRDFSKEFKLEAVRQLERGDKSGVQVALELDVPRNKLYQWREQVQTLGAEKAFPGPGRKSEAQMSELELLRKENKRLQMENEFLKKVEASFKQVRS
jgi:transposase